jgi:hypothetical protein
MKQEIQATEGKFPNDLESNMKIVSDDDALLATTGKVGELKRCVPSSISSFLREKC